MQQCNALTRNYKRCRQVAVLGHTMCQEHLNNHAPVYTRQPVVARDVVKRPLIGLNQYTPIVRTRTVDKRDYRAYLETEGWKKKAEERKRDNPKCSLCNREIKVMHVHHRTYVRCGNEDTYDLTVLCSDCHDLFHKHYQYSDLAGCFIPNDADR